MSYFDHVRCHACKAMLDPESLGGSDGKCPRCGVQLSLKDLFGLSAAFSEEEEGDVSLDDLVPGSSAPASPQAARPAATPPSRPAPSPASKPKAPARPAAARPASGTALVHKPAPEDEEAPPAKGSALDAMRSLKKKR